MLDRHRTVAGIEHSCVATDGHFADPAIRIGGLVHRFGDNGSVLSVCSDNWEPVLTGPRGAQPGPAVDRADRHACDPFVLVVSVAVAAGCDRPLPPARTRAPAAAAPGGQAGTGGTFTPTRKVDMLFVIDDSSSVRLLQDNLNRNFPTLMQRLHGSASGLPTCASPCHQRHGRGRRIYRRLQRDRRQERDLPVHGAGHLHAYRPRCRRDVYRRHRHVRNYTGNLHDVFTCIAPLGESGCGFEHQLGGGRARAGRRWAAAARGEPRLPAARRLPLIAIVDRRGRLLGTARFAALRQRQRYQPRLAARPASELPLQRVRPPLQRRQAAAHRADRQT